MQKLHGKLEKLHLLASPVPMVGQGHQKKPQGMMLCGLMNCCLRLGLQAFAQNFYHFCVVEFLVASGHD